MQSAHCMLLQLYAELQALRKLAQGCPLLTEGTAAVIDALARAGLLLREERYAQKYPYDWRTKQPTIFRATDQARPARCSPPTCFRAMLAGPDRISHTCGSGSSAWRASRLQRRRQRRAWRGCRRRAPSAYTPCCRGAQTGASAASARGAYPSQCSTTRTLVRPAVCTCWHAAAMYLEQALLCFPQYVPVSKSWTSVCVAICLTGRKSRWICWHAGRE